jgi:hypothetical protein
MAERVGVQPTIYDRGAPPGLRKNQPFASTVVLGSLGDRSNAKATGEPTTAEGDATAPSGRITLRQAWERYRDAHMTCPSRELRSNAGSTAVQAIAFSD